MLKDVKKCSVRVIVPLVIHALLDRDIEIFGGFILSFIVIEVVIHEI